VLVTIPRRALIDRQPDENQNGDDQGRGRNEGDRVGEHPR
jgi:hypothetical protein